MPRNIDPGTLRTGPGRPSAKKEPTDLGGASPGLSTHVGVSSGAHAASAISIDAHPPQYDAVTVEGALDELSALIPPRPPRLGNYVPGTGVGAPGIPDWGVLKLNDAAFDERTGATDWGLDPGEAYQYYYRPPVPRETAEDFSAAGEDSITDTVFNIADGTYTGGGSGSSHAGGFTRGVAQPVTSTMRIVPSSGPSGGKGVVVSGVLYPADRGVLALLHWPSGGAVGDFLALPLLERCPAALLLGQGISSGCDGLPGGMFILGDDGSGNFDPFVFPGQATGQYDLEELHTAVSTIDSTALPFVADPDAGKVRLGTDAGAGVPVVAGGIPMFGGTTAGTGGGDDNNFFRYRLPYLSDYSDGSTGLPYTPTAEKPRYFLKPTLALDAGTDLTQAGNYTNYPKDYWTFQVARYRHRFTLDDTLIGAGSPRDNGSWMLLHFKTEVAFEALVRDGVAPADEDLYSANLVDWVDPEAPENIATDSGTSFPQASSYHVLRSLIYEDPDGANSPAVVLKEYELTKGGPDRVMWVSGVQYFVPVDTIGTALFITRLRFTVNGLFDNTYLKTEPGKTGDVFLGDMNPVVLNMAFFARSSGNLVVPGALVQDAGKVRRQRIELTYEELGAFTSASGPTPGATATYDTLGNNISALGDTNFPNFSVDGRVHLHMRRPLAQESVSTAVFTDTLPEVSGSAILIHSSRATGAARHGNVELAPGVPQPNLESISKDTEERFLDEVYRYTSKWTAGTLPVADANRIAGPGLPGGASVIEIPVRPATALAPYDSVSWFQLRNFTKDLSANVDVTGNAQVAGQGLRTPSLDYPVLSPTQARGVLMYPQVDYSTGFRPSFFDGDVTTVQVSYNGVTGDVVYFRAFDAAFSRSGTVVSAEGQPFVLLQVWGLKLADYAYAAPGPGNANIAILVKVPGLTTWMDIGRNDGGGPSKQDAFADGAGCKVLGVDTFDGQDNDYKTVYSQVKINVGPTANLFKSANGEVPLLVKVIIKDSAGGRALDFLSQTTATGDPGLLRGLVGLEIVRPS